MGLPANPLRSVYRVIEFADGFNGSIAHTQVLFSKSILYSVHAIRCSSQRVPDVFDGAMVTLAMYTLNAFHPGVLLKKTAADAAYALADRSGASFSQRTSPTVQTSFGGFRDSK